MMGALVARHRAVSILGTLTIVLGGCLALGSLPSGVYPEVDFPRIVVVAHGGDVPADVAVETLARPLEQSLATVLGVVRVRSKSVRGACEISLTFADGTDMEAALQHVESAVARSRTALPAGTETEIERLTPTAFPVVTFNLAGPIDPRDLRELAELVVRPALAQVPGVGLVRVHGGDVREVEVVLDPLAASSAGLGPLDVAARLRAETALGAAGRLERDGARMPLVVSGDARDLAALRAVPIASSADGAPLTLGAIAEVDEGTADATARVSGPRGTTVVISVSRAEGAGTPAVVRAAEQVAAAIPLPEGVTLEVVYDQADLVDASLASVREAILVGIALCLVVLGASLRDLRAGIIAAATVPIVLASTFLVMRAVGATLDLMSLGGMAIAVGLVIDDAIIVLEAIARRLEAGEDPERAAIGGVDDIGAAVVGTTITTVVVLVPLAFVSGLVGEFFTALAIPLSAAVLLSLVVSLTSLPIAAARWLKAHRTEHQTPWLESTYRAIAGWGARRAWLGPILVALTLVAGAALSSVVPAGFLPALDEGSFVLDYFMPPGTSLEATDAAARRIEQILRETPSVETYTRRTGIELGPAAATGESSGDIMVRLVPREERDASSDVQDEIRARIEREVPEVRIEIIAVLEDVLNDLADTAHPVEIEVFGDVTSELERTARDIGERLAPIDGLADLYDGVEGDSPVRVARVDVGAAMRAHVTSQDVLDRVAAGLLGAPGGSMPFRDRRLPIRVRYPDALRFSPDAVSGMPLVLPATPGTTATSVPVGAVVRFEDQAVPVEIRHEALRPVIVVSSDVEGRDLGAVTRDVDEALRDVAPPPGGRIVVGGQTAARARSFRELALVLGFGLLLTLVALVAQFRRLRPAIAVLLTTPFALTGALAALYLTGTALDVSAMMGMVLLVGLEVKAGILLLEVAEEAADAGRPYVEALELACARRIRPIMMTATATLAGVLPLALETGAGAEIQRPLAIAVLGGIGLSKFVTLVALPALAAALRGRARTEAPGAALPYSGAR